MILLDDRLAFSATDLTGFLACAHLPSLRRDVAEGRLVRPPVGDGSLAARYGDLHESAYLDRQRREGKAVKDLTGDGRPVDRASLLAAHEATAEALAEGHDVLYQATLFDGTWFGHPDFLVRRDDRSGRWPFAYEVVDTKLARHTKASALVQVALYGELLAPVQGCDPAELVLVLGDGTEERFGFDRAAAYLRAVRRRFLASLDDEAPYPYPVEHCEQCAWNGHCDERRRSDDHLSLVAGIRRQQILRLEDAGVQTLEQLATVSAPPRVRIGEESLARLRRQAEAQYQSRIEGRPGCRLLSHLDEASIATLPEADPGDVFFDLEGFPYANDGGLEYLFGWVDAEGAFHHRFSEDRAGERRSFEAFMDELARRRAEHPGMHVYHYAPYERSALVRLSNRYGAREEEVSDLLRYKVLVDLYGVVRHSLVAGTESYSLKALEPLYGFERTGEVRTAAESMDMYQAWLDSSPRDSAILEAVARYNEVDCASTRALRDWLLGLRLVSAGQPGEGDDTSAPTARTMSDTFRAWLARVERLTVALTGDLGEEHGADDDDGRARRLLADLLKFHQREQNAQWREHYHRLGCSLDELVEDPASLGDLRYEGPGERSKRSQLHVSSFPAQDVSLRVGASPLDPATGASAGRIVELEAVSAADPQRGRLVLSTRATAQPPHPVALIPPTPYDDYVLRDALCDLAEWVCAHGIGSDEAEWAAARQLLLRRPPRVTGAAPGDSLALPGESGSEAMLHLVPLLDAAALPVQGPPGSGKTWTAAQAIAAAVGRGELVAVSANSHRVVANLLGQLAEVHGNAGLRILHKCDKGAEQIPGVRNVATNLDVEAAVLAGEVDVVGGTAWLMARPSLAGQFDLLVVDEAGQVSLANALVCSQVARNVLLIGDPAQLDQPTQASHPDGAAASALTHVLGEAATMPPRLGVFLERTRRMHPAITAFISDVAYAGRLHGIDGLERQRVQLREGSAAPPLDALAGAGLRFLSVEHEGNRTSSPEEADVVAGIVEALVGGTFIAADGSTRLLGEHDVLVVAPYNAHVGLLRSRLPAGVPVGTVDRFQGRQAPVVIYSMASSTSEDLPRGIEFLYSLNRLNVAVSRAQALAVLVCSAALLAPRCRTPRQVELVNALCRFAERATSIQVSPPL